MRHLRLPLTVAADGSLSTLAEDSPGEVAQSAAVLLATRVGERRSEPTYGSRDDLFGPYGTARVDEYALALWEPRAAGTVEITVESR